MLSGRKTGQHLLFVGFFWVNEPDLCKGSVVLVLYRAFTDFTVVPSNCHPALFMTVTVVWIIGLDNAAISSPEGEDFFFDLDCFWSQDPDWADIGIKLWWFPFNNLAFNVGEFRAWEFSLSVSTHNRVLYLVCETFGYIRD